MLALILTQELSKKEVGKHLQHLSSSKSRMKMRTLFQ